MLNCGCNWPNNNDEMIGSRIPRILVYAMALGVLGAGIMLSLFYGQYRWLANQLVSASYDEHRTLLEASFERRARAELHGVADLLPADLAASDTATLLGTLNRAMADHPALNGLGLADADGRSLVTGNLSPEFEVTKTTWQDQQLVLSYVVRRGDVEAGRLWGSFDLASLQAELDKFAAELHATEAESRRISYLWIGGGALAVLLLCGGIVWLITSIISHSLLWNSHRNEILKLDKEGKQET